MSNTKANYVTPNVPCCDISIQDRYEDKQFFQHCKPPPPPPGNEDLWELQFCRWWGWNWVRKKEEQGSKKQDVHWEKKPEKKHIKALCNCLRFKKEPKVTPSLQNLYNTPSNTIKPEKNVEKVNSIEQLERQRNVSQKSNRDIGRDLVCNEGHTWETLINKSLDSSSDDRYHCNLEKSNTDESIEYINIRCCHCCHSKKKSDPEKCDCETQTSKHLNMTANDTQTPLNNPNVGATQTSRKPKKKKIRLICCHCTQNPSCHKCHKSSAKLGISTQTQNNESNIEKRLPISSRFESVYMGGLHYPWDTMLYYNKHFSKFGNPSQNYPWLLEAKSDLSDKLYSLKIEKEFASPVSGNIYKLTPENLCSVDKNTTLPDPIEIGDELDYLKRLESEVKIDLENRVMLDAVCDAILSDGSKASTSALLRELNYSYETESNNTISDIKNNEEKYELPKFESYTLDETHFGIIKDGANEFIIPDLDTISLNTDIQQDSNLLKDSDELKTLLEDKISEFTLSRTVALNCDLTTERAGLKKFTEKNSQTKNTGYIRTNSRNKNISTVATRILNSSIKKRGVTSFYKCPNNFCNLTVQANRSKWEESNGTRTPNINEIFNKIDEIVLKSKVNNEEIQNVLNAIPKKDYQIHSSEDVTNSNKEANLFLKISSTKSTLKDEACSISKLQGKSSPNADEKDICEGDQSFIKKSVEGVQKVSQQKKKKKVSKPSFIPIKNTDKQKTKKKNN